MQPNERLKKGSHEFMLFPGTSWSCAQYWGEGTYSHCCGFPLDWTGGDLYAPCTVRSGGCIDPATNCELWYSTDTVWVPGAKEPVYVAFQVGHSESMRGTGTVVPQGAYLNSMGTFMGGHSGGCGLHAHIEFVNLGTDPNATTGFVNGGCAGVITDSSSIGAAVKSGSCFNLTNSKPYYEVCYMNDTSGDSASPYAGSHQYAKGLSWFVPQDQRALALNDEEVYNNMRCVYGYFKCLKEIDGLNKLYESKAGEWTDGAIAGLLANMTNESGMHPNKWEGGSVGNTSRGYGLVQWTPATNVLNVLQNMSPVEHNDVGSLWEEAMQYDLTLLGNAECQQIFTEYCQGQQWIAVDSISWEEWAHSDVYDSASGASLAAMIFQQNYERPLTIDPRRGVDATNIYNQIKGEKWDKEMPAGLLQAEIINPWDLATDVANGQFRVRKDFIPVYWCPWDKNKKEAITFTFSHYLFVKDGVQPYQKAYFGAGGFTADNLDKAIVTTWFAWGNGYDSQGHPGHYFSPSTNTLSEFRTIFLEPIQFKEDGKIKIDIDKRFNEIYFYPEEQIVEDPYAEKILFTSQKLPITYNLVQTGSYDQKAAQKKDPNLENSIIVWGSEKNAVETMESLASSLRTAHFFVDSNNVIQELSLERKSHSPGYYTEKAIEIYLTNTSDNRDMDYAQTLIAELFYQGFVEENIDTKLIFNVSTNVPFNENTFRAKVKEKLRQLKQQDSDRLQSKILTKIKSQQKYEVYLERLDYLINEEIKDGL